MTDILNSRPDLLPDHLVEPVYFAVENPLTAGILWDHQRDRSEVFSPLPKVVGNLEPTDEEIQIINDFGEHMGINWLPWEISVYQTISGIRIEPLRVEYGYYAGLEDLTQELSPLIERFVDLADTDAKSFFCDDYRMPLNGKPSYINLQISQRLSGLPEGTRPNVHTDGVGGPRGRWKLAHLGVIGEPTLQYTGLATERNINTGSWIVDHLVERQAKSGDVNRLHPTSLHAIPIIFDGVRLVMRKFQPPYASISTLC